MGFAVLFSTTVQTIPGLPEESSDAAYTAEAGQPPSGRVDEIRLSGDITMWFVIVLEMFTFGLLFVVYAFARAKDPAMFRAGQSSLDLRQGAINTVILLTGSWCVARGVHALRSSRVNTGARWLWSAAALGIAFLLVKGLEYKQKLRAGYDMSSDDFWMFYYLLTGFHFMHVAAAVLIVAAIAFLVPRRQWTATDTQAPETAAVFWHMVDLLWVVLFPLVYVLR
ncbi:cytochrome c oxidase subunit 3 [uncultured Azohydromonas sp.]|jgi:Heme/copper-type cytochrome/quinol oxidase, subunit 3|uniref:cytochrome c oxidase subunit 3 n=1 Tax=uncultured Azohydromonas sp. TaxID=487342 RepID=UPI0026026B09|nr:cytochrome c oxidase subunit 3 [uncultured Azohydromonas sp.]